MFLRVFLSKELQELKQSEIISRTVIDPKLTSVEYELTAHDKTLEGVLLSIANWGMYFKDLFQKKWQRYDERYFRKIESGRTRQTG